MPHWPITPAALLLTLTLLSACQGDDTTDDVLPTVDILSRFNSEGKAWMSLHLNLPKGNATRAATMDDGTEQEYAVKDVTFVLFSGTSEAEATVSSSYRLYTVPTTTDDETVTDPAMSGTGDDDVTCTIQFTSRNIEPGDNAYLLVILNAPAGLLTGIAEGKTLTELPTLTSYLSPSDAFVMTNAPLAPLSAASPQTATTLVKIDPMLIFATEEEA